MNILMIHPHDLFDKSEPWTIRIKSLAKEFVKKQNKVKLCYFPLSLSDNNHGTRNMDSVELIPLQRYSSPRALIANTLKLIKLSKWADVVHFQKCHHYASIPAVLAAYISGRPLHYDWDDWEEKIWYESCGRGLHSRFIGSSFKVLERLLPVLADSVSCASDYLINITGRSGIKKENIFYTPVGADLDLFHPRNSGERIRKKFRIDNLLVIYIGQLHGAQYIDLYIRAANIVLHKNHHVSFMIVGEGFMERTLRDLVYELGIEDKVIFTGSVHHNEIPEYIAAADVCVATFKDTKVTRCKSPLKIVEYLASGKAIVASNVGEVRKMLGGVGILAEPGDYHSLADGILFLLADRKLRERLGNFARQRAEYRYNWAASASSLLAAYEKLTVAKK